MKEFIDFLDIIINTEFDKNINVYNFGTGESYTIKEVIELLEKIMKIKKNIIFNPEKIRIGSDYNDVRADITKIKNELNFKFKYTFEESLKSYIELYKINEEIY